MKVLFCKHSSSLLLNASYIFMLFAKLHFQKLNYKAGGHKINCISSETVLYVDVRLFIKICSYSSYKLTICHEIKTLQPCKYTTI